MEKRMFCLYYVRGVVLRGFFVLVFAGGFPFAWAQQPPALPQDVIQRLLDAERKKREEALKPVDPFEGMGKFGQIIRDALVLAANDFKNGQAAEKAGKLDEALSFYEKAIDRLEFADDPDNPDQPVQVTSFIPEKTLADYMEAYTTLQLNLATEALKKKDYKNSIEIIHRLLSRLPPEKDIPDPDDANKVLFTGVESIAPYRARAANLLAQVEKAELTSVAKSPSRDVTNQLAAIAEKKKRVKKLIIDGRIMYEAREYELADNYFRDAIELDPGNDIAYNYLKIMLRHSLDLADKRRRQWFRDMVQEVNDKWLPPLRKKALPTPNPYYLNKTGLGPQSSIGRDRIQQLLQDMRVPEIQPLNDMNMAEVVGLLDQAFRDADPLRVGVNFQVDPLIPLTEQQANIAARQLRTAAVGKPAVDPNSGLPILQKVASPSAGTHAATPSLSTPPDRIIADQIKVSGLITPLRGLNGLQLLDVVCRSFDRPIKYEVTDSGVVIGHKPPKQIKYDNREFKVNPNAFKQGLVVTPPRGGLMSSDRPRVHPQGSPGTVNQPGVNAVYNLPNNGGGMQYKATGGILANVGQAVKSDDRIYYGLGPGGGAPGGGAPGGGAGGGGAGGGGLNNTQAAQEVQQYLQGLGINVSQVVFNDRRGILLIRAPLADMALVEAAIEVLNATPPQVLIESKFMEIEFDDNNALGFDWFVGDSRLMGQRMLSSIGTAPSFIGQPTANNPSGFFPYPGTLQNDQFVPPQWTIQPRPTDGHLTSTFKQHGNPVLTITGILTDPQFRMVLNAMESQEGADVLSAPKIITVSGRPANISVQDQRDLVVGVQPNIQIGPFGGAAGGTMTPITMPMPFGPTLDVVPYVGADGFTIEMNLRPQFLEFMGYEDSSFEATAFAGGNVVSQPIASPRIRQRQLDVQCVVWDQQTLMMGGLISESVTTHKDKVPFLGDIPFLGGLFRGESTARKKKNMQIFVTPKIIDPSGHPVNTPETLPYMRQFWPPDSAPVPQGILPAN